MSTQVLAQYSRVANLPVGAALECIDT